MITYLIEMLKLPNFGHMAIFTMYFGACDKILLMTSWPRIMTS